MSLPAAVLMGLVMAGIALLADHYIRAVIRRRRIAASRDKAALIVGKAEREARSRLEEADLEARVKLSEAIAKAEKEAESGSRFLEGKKRDLNARDKNLQRKTQLYEERLKKVESREKALEEAESAVAGLKASGEKLLAEQRSRLEQVSGYTAAMAKRELMREMESEARSEAARIIHRVEEQTRERAAEQAQWVIAQAIQRYSPPQLAESTVTILELPSDDMKARIIGREGRNIRAIEMAMGVDLIIDDTPRAIVLSSFNPLRRAIAKTALERLVEDGRIHPARIEEVVAKVKDEFAENVTEQGESAAFELGLHDFNPRVYRMAGRLKYMTYHGQNLLQHSQEVATIAAHIGGLLGIGADNAKRAGFLHKIGFADETNVDRSPLLISPELAQRLGEPEPVVHCLQVLYGLVAPRTIEAAILPVAERVSVSRPGAQREMLQSYLERLAALEELGRSFTGVKEVYAMRAGREIRVLVEPESVGDKQVVWMSREIAKEIEKKMDYPGQVKVSVIRETRAVDFAM
jgi:ribonuclease Y